MFFNCLNECFAFAVKSPQLRLLCLAFVARTCSVKRAEAAQGSAADAAQIKNQLQRFRGDWLY